MKFLLSTITILFVAFSFAQTAQEYYKNGVQKHNKEDYKGAIKDYNNAIKVDKGYTKAYFNRGFCYLALSNYKAVKKTEISTDLKTKWIAFFKTAKVVNQ